MSIKLLGPNPSDQALVEFLREWAKRAARLQRHGLSDLLWLSATRIDDLAKRVADVPKPLVGWGDKREK